MRLECRTKMPTTQKEDNKEYNEVEINRISYIEGVGKKHYTGHLMLSLIATEVNCSICSV